MDNTVASSLINCSALLQRGLPHAHIVIWLKGGAIPVQEIHKYISAELPDSVLEPALHAVVTKHMLHSCSIDHCKSDDPTSCYCKRGFPKEFSDDDVIAPDGANILYRRRSPSNGGRTFTQGTTIYDNSNVVSYNAYLLLRFDCHINVAAVTTIGCIKVCNLPECQPQFFCSYAFILSHMIQMKYLFKVCLNSIVFNTSYSPFFSISARAPTNRPFVSQWTRFPHPQV